MTIEERAVLNWLADLCAQADAHLKEGDMSFLNRMAANGGIKHYFDNVHRLRAVPAEHWREWYRTQYDAAFVAYQAAQQAEQERQRVTSLEERLATLEAYIHERVPTRKGK